MCILLVEDEPVIRDLMTEGLRESGLSILAAESAEEGVEHLRRRGSRICLLITDIHMSGTLTGIDLAREFRRLLPYRPVIFMTGRPDVLNWVRDGGPLDKIICKPFTPSQLTAMVNLALGGSAAPGRRAGTV